MESTERLFNSWGITYRQINDQYFSSADTYTSTHIKTHKGSFSEIIAWLPEIQSLWGHHKCIAGYHYLKGCAEKRPKEESPLDCNVTPECHKTAWDGWTFDILYTCILLTWWGSDAIFFLNCWNTLLSSVSCIAASSRSASVRAAGEKKI